MSAVFPYPAEAVPGEPTLDRCPTCGQLLVLCIGCDKPRSEWDDPSRPAIYCSARCKATTKKRRHRRRSNV